MIKITIEHGWVIPFFLTAAFVLSATSVSAQASLFSVEEPYLRVLELEGKIDRPYLTYRSLNDESWDSEALSAEWPGFYSSGSYKTGPLTFRLYSPETFISYNSAYPHGTNDGALWQGVGINTTVSAGVRADAFGFSLSFKPEVHYSQNKDFDIMPTAYPESDGYGYFWAAGLDVYQRPGEDSISDWSWGDSEIRYTWKAATIGIGTQQVWLGPGVNNALILSNNAAPFPKLDLGVKKIRLPYVGEVEARAFWGKLSESDWFDDNSDNNTNMITMLTLAWSPAFYPELTLGLNRAVLSLGDDQNWGSIMGVFIPNLETGEDESDQRFSLTGEILYTSVGFRSWFEVAYNDFYRSFDSFIRYPFHTMAYTLGLEKVWRLPDSRYSLLLQGEISSTESSRDTALYWPQTFYAHHIITQGYTNEGQIIGAGYGSGGNYQCLKFILTHPNGAVTAYVERQNRNNDYIYFLNSDSGIGVQASEKDRFKLNTEFTLGVDTSWILKDFGIATAGIAFNMNHNPLYTSNGIESILLNSVYFSTGLKFSL